MKIPTKNTTTKVQNLFHTGVKSLIDRKIGGLNVLQNSEILGEKSKIKNMRNGKVRP